MRAPSRLVTLTVLALVVLLADSASAATKYNIVGSGTATLTQLMQTLCFAFQSVNTASTVTWTLTSSGSGQANLLAGSTDFTGINSLPANSALGGLPAGTKFNSVIHSFDALLPTYNIPGQSNLNLTQTLLLKIWSNQLLWWNDSQITSINPNAQMPGERIRIVYRPDSAGTTVQWILNLQTLNSSYPVAASTAPASNTYPFWSTKCADAGTSFSSCQPYMIPATVATAMTAARMLTTPYSTGYIARPFAAAFGVNSFNMYNSAGNLVAPTAASVSAAVSYAVQPTTDANLHPKIKTNLASLAVSTSPVGGLMGIVNPPDPNAWPIVEYNIVFVNNNLGTDCYRALEIAQFVIWASVSDIARSAADSLGAILIPADIAQPILTVVSKSVCGFNGQFNVFDVLFPYETGIWIASVVFVALFWSTAILIIYYRRHPIILRTGVLTLFCAALFFGLNLFTVLLWLGYPTLPICQARPWVSATSFVVLYGAIIYIFQDRIFEKLNVKELAVATFEHDQAAVEARMEYLQTSESTLTMSSEAITKRNTVRMVLVFFVGLINYLIPIIWIAVEPPTMLYRQCVGSYENTFRQAMLFYNIVLIIILVFGALVNGEKGQYTSWPVHIMLIASSLFIPVHFLYVTNTNFVLQDRTNIGIALSPAVGILVSTIISGLLVIAPPLVRAINTPAEDEIDSLIVDANVAEMQQRAKSRISVAPNA